MNKDIDDILYDQDIGVEFRIVLPEIKYEKATQLEEILPIEEKTIVEVQEIKYEPVTNIEDVDLKERDLPLEDSKKEIKEESVIKKQEVKAKTVVKKQEIKKSEPQKSKKKETKTKTVKSKESKSSTKKKAKNKVDNSYTEGSTYLIILVIAISFAAFSLVLINRKTEKNSKVIQLYGEKTIILNEKDTYNEPGFVAIDFNQGDVTKEVVVENNVDTNIPGIYEIKYKLKKGSIDTEVIRNIIVTNKNDIDFKLSGDQTVFVKLNTDFTENGYTATYKGQDFSDKVTKIGEINLNKIGMYRLYYVIKIDDNVKVLMRNVVVYTGNIIDNNDPIVKEINNHIIDEVHYSNAISLINVNRSVLLYFGALNCDDLSLDGLNHCLNDLFKVDTIELKENVKYSGKNAEISFDKNENKFVIKRLDLPRDLENVYKVIVEGDNVYIYEKYAYEVFINNKEICDGKTKILLYSGVDRDLQTGYETCTKECGTCETVKNRNYTETLYLHTFKKVSNKYVWSKTEMIK